MGARLINGKEIAERIKLEVAREVESLKKTRGITPGLAVVFVGNDPASQVYVNRKKTACLDVGMTSVECRLDAEASRDDILKTINDLNQNPEVHGILVQLPLPNRMDEKQVLEAIDFRKDVDGFHPYNIGRLWMGDPNFIPCTPRGIIELIKWALADREGLQDPAQASLAGFRAVVIGRSNIVGKPVASLLLGENATVTVCHSRTRDLPLVAREADILVVAVGKPRFVGADFVKPGAIVIDVGVNRQGKRLVGDVDFEEVSEVAGYITPVPGGVGPMTIAMLLRNTLEAARRFA